MSRAKSLKMGSRSDHISWLHYWPTAYCRDGTLVKDLEENKYIAKYVEKPIHLTNLIEIVADIIC